MALATVHLAKPELQPQFYFSRVNIVDVARSAQQAGGYTTSSSFIVEGTGAEAAEDAFDLTNNPSRQFERKHAYGMGRSVSVGDIVEVDGVRYLCLPAGWTQL